MEEIRDGFVLDCSLTMAYCFDDEATPETDRIRDALSGVRAIVPALWPIEVANAVLVDDETAARAWADTGYLARAHQLSAYDATYLELAIRRGLPLACLDGKLKAAARSAGMLIFIG